MSTETAHPSQNDLQRITAFLQPHLEARAVQALHALEEFPGFSIVEARGQGRGRGAGGTYVASEYDLTYQRHIRIEIVCRAAAVDLIVRALVDAGWTGRRGDGVIFVSAVERFVRIREAGTPATETREGVR